MIRLPTATLALGCPCSAGRDPKPCATAWNKQCGAARNEEGHGRLPKSARCGNALGFRVGLAADWLCLLRSLPRRPDRCATPTAVRAGPISGGSSAHVSSYVDTACNQWCQTMVVRASRKGKRADVGAICRRARAIEYYPGRKDRQTAPRRLVRLERKSWLRDGRPSLATSDPGRLVRPVKESC